MNIWRFTGAVAEIFFFWANLGSLIKYKYFWSSLIIITFQFNTNIMSCVSFPMYSMNIFITSIIGQYFGKKSYSDPFYHSSFIYYLWISMRWNVCHWLCAVESEPQIVSSVTISGSIVFHQLESECRSGTNERETLTDENHFKHFIESILVSQWITNKWYHTSKRSTVSTKLISSTRLHFNSLFSLNTFSKNFNNITKCDKMLILILTLT